MTVKGIPTDFKEWYDSMDEDTKLLSAYVGYLSVKRYLGVMIETICGFNVLKDDTGKENAE